MLMIFAAVVDRVFLPIMRVPLMMRRPGVRTVLDCPSKSRAALRAMTSAGAGRVEWRRRARKGRMG